MQRENLDLLWYLESSQIEKTIQLLKLLLRLRYFDFHLVRLALFYILDHVSFDLRTIHSNLHLLNI
jgi:hypothetical protein